MRLLLAFQCNGPGDCRLGIEHPPNGLEFAIGCSLCAEEEAAERAKADAEAKCLPCGDGGAGSKIRLDEMRAASLKEGHQGAPIAPGDGGGAAGGQEEGKN